MEIKTRASENMPHLALILLALLFTTSAHAQSPGKSFFDQKPSMWWPAVRFNAEDTNVRGIPVKSIRANWCKATEYTKALFADDLKDDNGKNGLDEADLAFSLEGTFDGTGTRQTAVVGVYETCRGKKGGFTLIFDRDTRKIRFVDGEDALEPFAALRKESDTAIRVVSCLKCDLASVVRWDAKRKRFVTK